MGPTSSRWSSSRMPATSAWSAICSAIHCRRSRSAPTSRACSSIIAMRIPTIRCCIGGTRQRDERRRREARLDWELERLAQLLAACRCGREILDVLDRQVLSLDRRLERFEICWRQLRRFRLEFDDDELVVADAARRQRLHDFAQLFVLARRRGYPAGKPRNLFAGLRP